MFFSGNVSKENVKYAAVYDSWSNWGNHFSVLNNIISKHYPQYKISTELETEWFVRIMGGYQAWLLKAYLKDELPTSLCKTNTNDFLVLSLEEYLEKQRFIGDLQIASSVNDYLSRKEQDSLNEAGKVFWKMMLAVALNRATIYQRTDVDEFTKDIRNRIDGGIY